MACSKTYWHGALVCAHMVPKLNHLQTLCGSVYLRPIQGSYNTSVGASAGTHAGGGAMDISTGNMTTTRRTWIMNNTRYSFLIGWQRNAISGLWSNHCHLIDPSCPSLSSAARNQVSLYRQGYNGLVGNARDPGYRGNLATMVNLYLNRFATTAIKIAALFISSITPSPSPRLYPYGPFPTPYRTGSMYGPTTAGKPWYSGRWSSPTKSVSTIRWIITLIQRRVGVTRDGFYGPVTFNAVKKWQAARGLKADGVVGPATWKAMS